MKYDINHEFVSISSQTATHRIIMMHGWGADADDLLPLGRDLIEKSEIDFEVISLRAPGYHPSNIGRQWYGLYPHDWNAAAKEVNKLLLSLKKLDQNQIPLRKTILFGFSQGAAMAVNAGSKLNLGLIVSCSGYPHPDWEVERNCPPMIISHGRMDEVVPVIASRTIYEKVKNISVNSCDLIEFDGYHQISFDLIEFINLKIKDIF